MLAHIYRKPSVSATRCGQGTLHRLECLSGGYVGRERHGVEGARQFTAVVLYAAIAAGYLLTIDVLFARIAAASHSVVLEGK